MNPEVEALVNQLQDDFGISIGTVDDVGEAQSNLTSRYPNAAEISSIINLIEGMTGDDYVITRGRGLSGTGVVPVEELPETQLMSQVNPRDRGGNGLA